MADVVGRCDGLGVGSQHSPTAFSVIEVTEISGPGKKSPRKKPGDKKPDRPADDEPKLHADNAGDNTPMAGPTTRVANQQATIKSLEVQTTDSGMMLGQTSEVVLTVTRGDTSQLTSVHFATPVGDEMLLARDEALRFIHLTYPNWYADKAELTFEDKYNGHNGGPIGAVFGHADPFHHPGVYD